MQTLLVAGTGINGIAAIEHFAQLKGWRVLTLARGKDRHQGVDDHISANLLEPEDLAKHAKALSTVTHLFYAALKPSDDPHEEADENAEMMRNLLTALSKHANKFERVVFLQGGKVYGAHLGVYRTPAREEDSRHFPPNLYFRHEDIVGGMCEANGWNWTALRPDIVIGYSAGSPMNLGNLIGTYGMLCLDHGVAMQFPGTAAAYDVLVNITDQDLVGQALAWSINGDHDGAFNLTNGDVFRWRHVWPQIAKWFGLEPGEPQPISLVERLDSMGDRWADIAKRKDLTESDLSEIAMGAFGDFIFHVEKDAIFDVGKLRRAGFSAMDRRSDDSFTRHLSAMEKRGLIKRS